MTTIEHEPLEHVGSIKDFTFAELFEEVGRLARVYHENAEHRKRELQDENERVRRADWLLLKLGVPLAIRSWIESGGDLDIDAVRATVVANDIGRALEEGEAERLREMEDAGEGLIERIRREEAKAKEGRDDDE